MIQLDPGNSDQFCIMLGGLVEKSIVSVAPFSVAWRVEIVDKERYRERNYVR